MQHWTYLPFAVLLGCLACPSEVLADPESKPRNRKLRYSEIDESGSATRTRENRRRRRTAKNQNQTVNQTQSQQGSNIHKDQDGSINPYKALLSTNATFSSKSSTPEADGVEGETSTSSSLELNFNYLFRLDSLFVGPLLGYTMTKSEFLGEDQTSSTIDIGGLADFMLADVDRDVFVPHVYGAARYNTEVFAGSDDSASGYRLGGGGGVYYFLASNIAVDFKLEYQYQSLSVEESSLNSSIVTFGFGLAAFCD